MSTKNQTSQQNAFNPAAMSAYNTMLPAASQGLTSNISNPYGNMLFNNQLGMGQQQIATGGQNQMNSFLNSQQAMGMQPNSPMTAFGIQQNANQNMAQRSGLFGNLLNQASGFRQNSMQGALNFRPLQTGGNGTQMQTGVGSWLPQAIATGTGAALSMYNQSIPGSNLPGGGFTNANTASNYLSPVPTAQNSPFLSGSDTAGMGNYQYGPGNFLPTFLQQ